MRHAVRLADIWSCYAEKRSDLDELGPRITALEEACAELGRDPATIGRSAGIEVAPLARAGDEGAEGMVTGSAEEIADTFRGFAAAGYTQLEIMPVPATLEAVDALAPVLELLGAD
jgi:alkanesulfonate monooxygenase SsuD/methylene tetrahydromethanopterin reductase-like flavin-dependent oxidoreductase (luciferase family)